MFTDLQPTCIKRIVNNFIPLYLILMKLILDMVFRKYVEKWYSVIKFL